MSTKTDLCVSILLDASILNIFFATEFASSVMVRVLVHLFLLDETQVTENCFAFTQNMNMRLCREWQWWGMLL